MTCMTKTMSDKSKFCSHLQMTLCWEIRPCDIHKLATSFKLRKACELDGISNERLRHLTRRPLIYPTYLFKHCFQLSHFPKPWKEAKFITLPKPRKDPKFPKNLRPISLLFTTGKLVKKVILRRDQRHVEERDLLNASQFGFRAHHSMTTMHEAYGPHYFKFQQ
jgi:hypothetical protein